MGSPCLRPLEGKIGSIASPLTNIEVNTVDTQLIIMSIRLVGRFILTSIFFIKLHLILSYAFSKSIFKVIYPTLPLFLPREWMISWAIMASSTLFLPRTNAVWSGDIRFLRKDFCIVLIQEVVQIQNIVIFL